MPEMKRYKLDNGKTVWTTSLEAFKGTTFEGRIITRKKQE